MVPLDPMFQKMYNQYEYKLMDRGNTYGSSGGNATCSGAFNGRIRGVGVQGAVAREDQAEGYVHCRSVVRDFSGGNAAYRFSSGDYAFEIRSGSRSLDSLRPSCADWRKHGPRGAQQGRGGASSAVA